MAPLDRLVGLKMVNTVANEGTTTLLFDGGTLQSFTPMTASVPIGDLIGRTIESVQFDAEEALTLHFSGDEVFSISLASDDYVGPEAFCANFGDVIVVE